MRKMGHVPENYFVLSATFWIGRPCLIKCVVMWYLCWIKKKYEYLVQFAHAISYLVSVLTSTRQALGCLNLRFLCFYINIWLFLKFSAHFWQISFVSLILNSQRLHCSSPAFFLSLHTWHAFTCNFVRQKSKLTN